MYVKEGIFLEGYAFAGRIQFDILTEVADKNINRIMFSSFFEIYLFEYK